jgi:hypothetical protein
MVVPADLDRRALHRNQPLCVEGDSNTEAHRCASLSPTSTEEETSTPSTSAIRRTPEKWVCRRVPACLSLLMISPSDLAELPVEERLKCMEVLWDSLRGSEPDSPEWHGQVLSERRAKIESGEAKYLTGSELKKRLSLKFCPSNSVPQILSLKFASPEI